MKTRSRYVLVWPPWLLVAALLASASVPPCWPAPPAGAAPPTSDPTTAAGYGTRWLAAQVTPGGYVARPRRGCPTPATPCSPPLSLAAAGHDQATFDVDHELAGRPTWTPSPAPGPTSIPGATGYLLLVVAAAHDDATDFGGVDLVARLRADAWARSSPGCTAATPAWATPPTAACSSSRWPCIGLQGGGWPPSPAAAIDWLVAQQCGGSDEFDGAWMSYRAPGHAAGRPADARAPPSTPPPSPASTPTPRPWPTRPSRAVGQAPAHDALAWLARTQNSDGSFGFYVGNDGDPNSTGLVIQAIVAGGRVADRSGRWVQGRRHPAECAESLPAGLRRGRRRPGRVHLPRQRRSAPTCWPPSRGCGARPRPPSRSVRCRSPTHRCRASRPPRPPRVRRPPRPRPLRCWPRRRRRWTRRRPSPADPEPRSSERDLP